MSGQGPMSGNFGHFMVYAPTDKPDINEYGVARYGMEVQRLASTLNNHLADKRFVCGDDYTIADMACLPWFQLLRTFGYSHPSGVQASSFLNMQQYRHLNRWADQLMSRGKVQRGMIVCRKHPKPWLVDKRFMHLAADVGTKAKL
eukprot:3078558-Pyramimonas_sp.AAC.1